MERIVPDVKDVSSKNTMAKWDAAKRVLLGLALIGMGICGYACFHREIGVCLHRIDAYLHRGIAVSIINKSGRNLGPVTIQYNGGMQTVSHLPTNGRADIEIRVAGESNPSIGYIDHSGNTVSQPLDMYVEQGDIGNVEVTINADNSLRVVQEIWTEVFPGCEWRLGGDYRFDDTIPLKSIDNKVAPENPSEGERG